MNRPDPIPFDTHRFVKRLTKEGMPTGQAEVLADEQVALLDSNLATKQDVAVLATKEDLAATNEKVAQCATKEDFRILDRRVSRVAQDVSILKQDVAVLKSDLRTLKWVVSGVGFGMLTLVLGVSSLVIKIFWAV